MEKSERPSQSLHVRRCHRCGHTNNQTQRPNLLCDKCRRPFAPFYYFDEKTVPVMSDCQMRPAAMLGRYRPLIGISVYWENF